jgi:dsRNA-specific ribonuclease
MGIDVIFKSPSTLSAGVTRYLLFLIISAIIVPVVFSTYPETMCQSLEELKMIFLEGKSISGIARESRKPFTGSLALEIAAEKEGEVNEDEYIP